MNKLSILAIILISLFSMNFCEDTDVSVNGVSVKALGQSGKLVLTKNITNGNTTTEESVTVNFSALRERDINGEIVGKAGKVKHSFENFAQLEFAVSNFTEAKYQNLSVHQASLVASDIVAEGTNFTGTFYVFTQEGEITTGTNETVRVAPGAVKFSIDVVNWPFCSNTNSTCDDQSDATCCVKGNVNEIGSFLDFELEIKGNKLVNQTEGNTYDLGNSNFVLSNYSKLDGADFTQLPEGFPKYEKQGASDVFTFRFNKFEKSVSYDPVVLMNASDSSSNLWLIIGVIVGVIAIGVIVALVVKFFQNKKKEEKLMP
jgi:hypothetical protein